MQLSGSTAYKFTTTMHTKYFCVYMSMYKSSAAICSCCTLTKSKPFCKTIDNCYNSQSKQEKRKLES